MRKERKVGRGATEPPIGAVSVFFQCWLDCVFPMQCQRLCLVVDLFLFVLVTLTYVSLYNLWFQGCLSTVYKRLVPLPSPVWLYLLGGLIVFFKVLHNGGRNRSRGAHRGETKTITIQPDSSPSPPSQAQIKPPPTPCLPPRMCLGSSMNCAFCFLSAWLG